MAIEPLIGGIDAVKFLNTNTKYRPIPKRGQGYFGAMSWFGQFGVGKKWGEGIAKYKWIDNADNGKNASGLSQIVPGIAYMSNKTLKHWFKLTFPNDKTFIIRQVDIGPALWTNKIIDINAPLAEMAGYSPKNFPTGLSILFQYIGEEQPDEATIEYRKF